MKTFIAPSYQHNLLSANLLAEQNILMDIKILPLRAYIDDLLPIESNYEEDLAEILDSLRDQLDILRPYLNNNSFIQEIRRFHIESLIFDIPIESLDTSNTKNKELKLIFKNIAALTPPEVIQLRALKSKDIVLKDLYITQQASLNFLDQAFIKELLNKGAKIYPHEDQKMSKVNIYYATNKRAEIESVAQHIIEEGLDKPETLLVMLDENYLPVIKQVFARYNIPFNSQTNFLSSTAIKFIDFVNLLIHKDFDHLISFLNSNPLALDFNKDVIHFIQHHQLDLTGFLKFKYTPLKEEHFYYKEVEVYNTLALECETLSNKLHGLSAADDLTKNYDYLTFAFNAMIRDVHPQDELIFIKNQLLAHKEEIKKSKELIPLLKNILKQRQNSFNKNYLNVTQLDEIYLFQPKRLIVVGTNAQNYPKIRTLEGIIDESYVKNTNYPLKEKRLEKQLNHQKNLFNLSEEADFFYSLSTYDGKSLEPSFEINNLCEKYQISPKRYPLSEIDFIDYDIPKLSHKTAQKLFFQDKVLNASVSSLERYTHCPYSYFIHDGLKIDKNTLPSLSPAFIGNILHSLVEQGTQDKDFRSSDYLNEIFENLKAHFSSQELKITHELLQKQVKLVTDMLSIIEADHYFENSLSEYKFEHDMTLEDDRRISLLGYIDRVDFKDDYFRIIDYKSSAHRLSEIRVKQGLQLQLLTYLLMGKQEFKKEAAGAYYIGLNISNTNIDHASVKYSKPYLVETKSEDLEEAVFNNHRINGWHFADPELFYRSNKFMASINKNMTARGGNYNYDAVLELLETIYADIYDQISSGIISIKPHDNPCQYCDYKSICQTKTTNHYKDEYLPDLKLKGA